MSSNSKKFRDEAARLLREGRKATLENQRDFSFEIAATYKRLALDEERLRGERQRSHERCRHQREGTVSAPCWSWARPTTRSKAW